MLRSRYQSWLLPYLEGSLDPEKKLLLEAQLARDSALMAEAEQLRQTVTALRASAADQEPLATTGFSVWPGVQARIQNQPQRSFGRAWALGGVGVAAAAAGILMVTLSIHPLKTPSDSTSIVAKKTPAPSATQSSRVASAKDLAAPVVASSPASLTKPKTAGQPISTPSSPSLVAGPKEASIPVLPVPVNGKGGRDPFGIPTQKSHPMMMAQVPKGELYAPLTMTAPMPLPPMPVAVTQRQAPKNNLPEAFASERRDKAAILPPPSAAPKEFGSERTATHKDIVPGGSGAAVGGFGGGGNSNGIAPQDSDGKSNADAANSTDTTALPPAPNKITIPLPAAPRVLSATPAPALGQVQVRAANPTMADSSVQSNQTLMSKSRNSSEAAGNNAPALDLQFSEMQLRSTVSDPQYGSVDTEKKTQQLLETLRSSGSLANIRLNLLQERKMHPEDLEASRLFATLAAFQNDKDTALSERRRIVGLNGANAEDWYQLAVAAQHKEDKSTARNAYFQVLQIGGMNNLDHYAQAREFFMDSSKH